MLLGYGTGGASGWSGVWTTIWSGLGLVLLAVLFVAALQAIDFAKLTDRRIRRAREQVDQVVEDVILERVAYHLLDAECKRAGIEYGWLGDREDARRQQRVRRSGRVYDIGTATPGPDQRRFPAEPRSVEPYAERRVISLVEAATDPLGAAESLLARFLASIHPDGRDVFASLSS